jgi:nitroreductase
MDLYEAIRTRRNVHRYKKEEVPMEMIKKILKTGLQASSAMNEQPWEFIVVRDQDQIKKIAQFKYDHNMQGLIASKVPQTEAEKMAGNQRDAFIHTTLVAVIFDRKKRLPTRGNVSLQPRSRQLLGIMFRTGLRPNRVCPWTQAIHIRQRSPYPAVLPTRRAPVKGTAARA